MDSTWGIMMPAAGKGRDPLRKSLELVVVMQKCFRDCSLDIDLVVYPFGDMGLRRQAFFEELS